MKARVLKAVAHEAGVTVLALGTANIPLAGLAGRALGSLDHVRLDPAGLGTPIRTKRLSIGMVPLHLKGGISGHARARGIVVGTTVAQGVEYVMTNWEPSGRSEPDLTILKALTGQKPRHAAILDLERSLTHKEDEIVEDDGNRNGPGQRSGFIWTREYFKSCFEAIQTGHGKVYIPSAGWGNVAPRHSVVIERTRKAAGCRIPQWDVMTFSNPDFDDEALLRGYYDGHWFHGTLSGMDPRIIEDFDANGRMVSLVEGDVLAAQTVEAGFIMRVPSGKGPVDPESAGGVPQALQGLPGALMFDSRTPIRIPEKVIVITEPSDVWAILLRTTSGVFLPDAAPAALPRSFKRLAGAWVVGAVPVEMAI